ncbi:MAG: hypothetical protein IKR69_00510 [Bacteroidales bacterium]|nr:hypothetical protein [Bacteroidales bacterium]
MTKTKLIYQQPSCESLVVRFEGSILSNPDGYHTGGAGHYDDTDTNENGDF